VCRRDAACECQPTVTLRSLSPCARRPFACSNLAGQIMGVVQYNDEARSSRQAGVAGGGLSAGQHYCVETFGAPSGLDPHACLPRPLSQLAHFLQTGGLDIKGICAAMTAPGADPLQAMATVIKQVSIPNG
jgi:hypothetical protein